MHKAIKCPRDILYNTDIISSIVKLIVYSSVGNLVQFCECMSDLCVCLISPQCKQT